MGEKVNQYLPYLLGSLILGWLLYFAPQTIGVYGGNDNYAHWTIARYAFYSRDILLNMWGRPIYNGIMWFPAQFGLEGMKVANTVIFGGLALLISDTGRLLGLKNHPWLFVFAMTNVLLLKLSMSGMTEMLMAFVVLLGTHQAIKGNLWMAAIIISLTPFTRPEGWMFFFFFAVFIWFQKKPISLLGLVFGPLLFAFIGWPVFGKFLWYFSANPYDMSGSIYGNGDLFHFVKGLPQLMGWIAFILFLVGNYSLFKTKNKRTKQVYLFLLIGPFWAFLAVHSFLWWQGLAGSFGFLRVMGCVMPLASLLSWIGLNRIQDSNLYSSKRYYIPLLMLLLVIYSIGTSTFPKPEEAEVSYLKKVSAWYFEAGLESRKVYYYNNKMLYFLDRNPYSEEAHYFIPKKDFPNEIENESLILWDSKIAPLEGQFPLEKLMLSDEFEFIQRFIVSDEFKKEFGYAPDIYAFIKRENRSPSSNEELLKDPSRTRNFKSGKDLEPR